MIILAPMLAIPVFAQLGLYRAIIRYLPDSAVWTIAKAVTLAALLWVFAAFILRATGGDGVPRSIAITYWIGALITIEFSRFGARWLLFETTDKNRGRARKLRVLVVGTGPASVSLISSLQSAGSRLVLGILSRDTGLHGRDLAGVRVSPISALEDQISALGIEEIILTAESGLDVLERRKLISSLKKHRVRIQILPAHGDVSTGRHLVDRLREVEIADLLGRDPVSPDITLLRQAVNNKTILVTGAAGSIGSALAMTISHLEPKEIILLDHNEHGVFELSNRISKLSDVRAHQVLGSIMDPLLLERIFENFGIDTIYHCAAYKHVPLAEQNIIECIQNNVFGTYRMAEAALKYDVKNFVLISTDKAVRPGGTMGATKRWAELIIKHFSSIVKEHGSGCRYATVRFGNVLGSSGSVVPLFQEQIARGGPVTLTDVNMSRYFMSIEEAADLIIQASVIAESDDVMVLDMGKPVKIRDLAEQMILLSGLSVRNDGLGEIEIVVTGARDGEKIEEELFYDESSVAATLHPRILRSRQVDEPSENVPAMLEKIETLIRQNDPAAARRFLFQMIDKP